MNLTTENAKSTKSEERISAMGHDAAAAAEGILESTEAPRPSPEEQAAFMAALGAGEWRLSTSIARETGLNPRLQRACAQWSHGHVISGKAGYRLTRKATVEDLDRFEARMISQIKIMTRRVAATRRARNGAQ